MSRTDGWNPDEYRKNLTTGEIIATLMAHLPTRSCMPKMPTVIAIEEAIRLLSRVERMEGVVKETFHIFKSEHTTDHPECSGFNDGCGTCLYLAKVAEMLEVKDGRR